MCDSESEALAGLIANLESGHQTLVVEAFGRGKAVPPHVLEDVRVVGRRLQELLELLDEELEDPELSVDDLTAGGDAILAEVESIQVRIQQLLAQVRGHGR